MKQQVVLGFSCYVFGNDRQLLLSMRGHGKRTWPGVWTNSCGGYPAHGESLPDAVTRTLHDELGLVGTIPELVLPGFRFCAKTPDGLVADELCPVYRVVTDERPRPNPTEVGDFEWVEWIDFVYSVASRDISVSPWCRSQTAELCTLGEDPTRWPVVDADPLVPRNALPMAG